MNKFFDTANPLFWTLIAACASFGLFIINILLYLINKRTFKLLYLKPKIKITEISVKPRVLDSIGSLKSDCFINMRVFNPSSFGNHISGTLRKSYFSKPITTEIYQKGVPHQDGSYCELPPFGNIGIGIYPDYERVKKYENQKLLLTISDIRGKKSKKRFIFKNMPL